MRRVLAGLALAIVPLATAFAANGLRDRTPVLWRDVPCMIVVDKQQVESVHIPYAIPYEDADVTVDELPDSRTHQFVAFCRGHTVQAFLPRWLSDADVERAGLKGIVDPAEVDAQLVMETNSEWADCFLRITADDARRPITFAAASEGVDWMLAAVPPGTYTIEGYTFEPELNLWSPRPGVVKVIDSDLDPDPGPAAAITTPELVLYKAERATIAGCVDAAPGTTVDGYWRLADDEVWQPFVTDLAIEGDEFAIEFTAPIELAGETGLVRLDFTDPLGRTFVAHMPDILTGLLGDDPDDCGTGGNFMVPGCAATDAAGVATDDGTDDANDRAGSGASGCGCTQQQGLRAGGAALLAMLLLLLRRRRALS
jgi:hypothetical protein